MKTLQTTNDCDVILNGLKDSVVNLENCFESVFDERQSKMGVIKNLFRFGGSLTKLAFDTTTCAVKHAPKAVVAVASVKREVVHAIEDEIHEYKKAQQEDALLQKIKQLQQPRIR